MFPLIKNKKETLQSWTRQTISLPDSIAMTFPLSMLGFYMCLQYTSCLLFFSQVHLLDMTVPLQPSQPNNCLDNGQPFFTLFIPKTDCRHNEASHYFHNIHVVRARPTEMRSTDLSAGVMVIT